MRIHIVSIAGIMTAFLAKALKNKGHIVSGSDQDNIFPPVSDIIKKSNISFNQTAISKNIDLAIIGSSYDNFSRTKSEFEQIKSLDIPYISATNYIAQNLSKKNSILVAGSFGKTTITGLVSQILLEAKFDPNFMIGGYMISNIDSIRFGDSTWSVIEADESIHGLDTQAKLLYYPVKYLILTSINWEHKDSYNSEAENQQAYFKLVKKVPKNGFMVINEKIASTIATAKNPNTSLITYGGQNSDYSIKSYTIHKNQSTLTIKAQKREFEIKTNLIGRFNFENILAAVALSDQLKIDTKVIQTAIEKYQGIKRRLELVFNKKDVYIYNDFAQSAPRIESALSAIKVQFPEHKIIVYFEAHAGFLQTIKGLHNFQQSFQNADKVILGKIKFNLKINKLDRLSASDYKKIIGSKLQYVPLEQDVAKLLTSFCKDKIVIINMSSGGIQNHQILETVVSNLKSQNV